MADTDQEILEATSEPDVVEAADTDYVEPEPVAEPAQASESDIDPLLG